MSLPDLLNPYWFLVSTGVFFAVVLGRYLLIAGLFYSVFYLWFPENWRKRKLSKKQYATGQFKRELGWSIITALIFSLAGTLTIILWQQGYTLVYTKVGNYGWWWLPLSLVVSMVIHETYYYWLHRWMHRPAVFRIVHKVHHLSTTTSPWTAFSFHPIEGIFQALILPATLLILPLHPSVILIQLTVMTFSSVINHLDIEIYPRNFNRHMLGKWLIGATHHSLHHKQFKYNYGLYFTFWDKWKRTESPLFSDLFESTTAKKDAPQSKG